MLTLYFSTFIRYTAFFFLLKIKTTWDKYYKQNIDTALNDQNLFSMEITAIKKNFYKKIKSQKKLNLKILELGSGTGFLASELIKILKKEQIDFSYIGIDFSQQAVKKAQSRKLKNCQFIESDFFDYFKSTFYKFDYIISQRSIMAIMNDKEQKKLLKLIYFNLKKSGFGLFSECSKQSLKNIQQLRIQLSVKPFKKIWHSNYVDEKSFSQIFSKSEKIDFCSTYYLITRIIYPYFEEPKHNTQLHLFASSLKQFGDYGLVKLFIVKP
jgi:ubiquinone/menaquinone biosynthesis C-methylase UbiE